MASPPAARTRTFVVEGLRPREVQLPAEIASGRTTAEALDLLGAAVYEGVRTYDGSCFFALDEHLRRLAASCTAFFGELAFEPSDLRRALSVAGGRFRMDEGCEARVRIDVCSAPLSVLGSPSRVLFTLTSFRGVPRVDVQNGVEVATTADIQRPRAEVKDSHWTVVREQHIRATPRLAACYEPMLVDTIGRFLEGVQSSLVFVRESRLWTAPSKVLRGVTRDTVLELSPEEPALEFVTVRDLPNCEESFLTSSVRGVVPIVRIDGQNVGDGRPGPVTRELVARYEAHVAANLR